MLLTPSPESRTLAGVVVTFNRLQQLKTTVHRSLQSGLDALIVVNNASSDGTREWLDAQVDSRLVVLHLPTNVGGAGGFNRGFDHVVQHTKANWLVCYDDDAFPEVGSLDLFRQLDLPRSVAGVAAAVYLPDGRISEMNRPSRDPFRSMWTFFKVVFQRRAGFHIADMEYGQTGLIPIDFSSFVGCFLRVDAIRQHLGLPRAELFIYADDIMYTHGIGLSGLQHLFAPEVHFVHDCATLHEQLDVYKPIWKVYYTYRNRLELFRQVSGSWLFYPIAIFKLLSWMGKVRHYEKRSTYLRLTLRAWVDGMRRDFSRTHSEVLALVDA